MSSFLRKLHKCRRNAAAAAASVSFLVLVLVFSVLLPLPTRHADGGAPRGAWAVLAAELRQGEGQRGHGGASCPAELRALPGAAARCRYLSSPSGHPPCAPRGYVDYLRLFYCGFGRAPALGGAALALWLLVLFYLLGDTASEYFCASLESLSAALRLPPAVAGATLLSLGNGAPDVLSSVVAFAGDGGGEAGDVGLSSVLGGALFVSTVVAGVVAIVAGRRAGGGDDAAAVTIERRGFVRDVCFLLVALCYLLAVLINGTVTVWAAAAFLSLYAAYVLLVWTSHCCGGDGDDDDKPEDSSKKQPGSDAGLAAPLLVDDAPISSLPISSNPSKPPPETKTKTKTKTLCRRVLAALHSPLYLPRRLTIPDIAAHRWSKPYAVSSAFLAPFLLAAVSSPSSPAALLSAAAAGTLLASAAAHATSLSCPPQTRCARLPWLAGGFLMSILWSYAVARELVALLVSIGLVAGVRSSVLGATVLAWGNSLGDLVSNVALAASGGGGARARAQQTAVAGCYAGPAFNTVVGLGLSLTLAAAARYPEPYAVAAGAAADAYQAAGFLAAGLVWALVVLPARGMRLDRVLGGGLLAVYLAFLAVRLASLGASPA